MYRVSLTARTLCLALLLALPALAGAAEEIEEVLVTGEQPGPGLWRVTQADHVLWILGSVTPLPKKLQWRSKQVESVLAGSSQVIGETRVRTNVGFFRGVTLLPSILRARENSDGATLKQILPPQLFARWETLKLRYIGNDSGIERWRPMFAAQELYSRALDRSGLSQRSIIWPTITQLARRHGVKVNKVEVKVDINDPKQLIRDFRGNVSEADITCLAATVEHLEHDLDGMKQRAQAWATGDIDALKSASYVDRDAACLAAATTAASVNQSFEAARQRLWDDWVAQAVAALGSNKSSFTVLPMAEMLQPAGRLARLQQLGYRIEQP